MEEDQSLDEVNATFRVKDLQQEEFHHVPLVKESLSSTRYEEKSAEAQRKIVSTHELPAPYGCRSVATKEGRHLRVRINMRCPLWYFTDMLNQMTSCRHAAEFP